MGGHIASMGKMTNVKKILVRKQEGTTSLGRPRRK